MITMVWAMNFTAPIFVKNYTPAPELNVAFMAILGMITAVPKRNGNGDSD